MSANTPPNNSQPRLALQIGVTGHRDLGLDAAGELALQAALTNKFELHCPLPFPCEVYAEDFQDEALATFKSFLKN